MVKFLEAASSVIVEVGYEATTMTEIAKRAGASIGAVYQYFPSKEAMVLALRTQYRNEMERRWSNIDSEGPELSVPELAAQFVDLLVDFMTDHPAYITLLDATPRFKRDEAARSRLRQQVASMFIHRKPELSPDEAYRIANVSLQVVKSMNLLLADVAAEEKLKLVNEYKAVLSAYLERRLGVEDAL